ncbi:peptidylprolyl isomerase [Shimia sp. FJ5]|uniref:peptidylprolyl isomerase n=1 Tax=Shimia sp. FJ5 TaxID=3079054 RepID=UPI00293DD3D9|nr:peptidylprolyl isomerase [Shimia sp. FJ5]MDV4145861.1 peptidylprolyl isomerase [Shimia sp. FJ5]
MQMKALFPDVVVNGTNIASADIAAEAQNHEAPRGKPGIAWRKAAHALVVRQLLLQEAARRGIDADPQELEPGRFETEGEALVRGVLEDAIQTAPPSDEETRTLWQADPDKYRAPPLWSVSHILVACDHADDAELERAKTRAQSLAERVSAKPESFGRIARAESDCPSKSRDGLLGQIGPGDTVPEFEAVLRHLGEGEVTPQPIQTRHGWHVIRLDAKAEGAVLPFEIVAPKLRAAMEKRAWGQAVRDFVQGLAASAEIVGVDLSQPL